MAIDGAAQHKVSKSMLLKAQFLVFNVTLTRPVKCGLKEHILGALQKRIVTSFR